MKSAGTRFFTFLSTLFGLVSIAFFITCENPSSADDDKGQIKVAGYYTITRPSQGELVYITLNDTIRWTSSRSLLEYVSIFLCQDTSVIDTISSLALNSGTAVWSPLHAGSGSNRRIKIASYTQPEKHDFSAPFTTYSSYFGTILVLSPPKDTIWFNNTSYSIQWTSSGSIGSSVKIQLYKDTVFVATIASSASNNGLYSWSPSAQASGTGYRIKISSSYDQGIYAFSDAFTIATGYAGTITVTAPKDTSRWSAGTSNTIRWTSAGNIGTYVRISLCQDSGLVAAIYSMVSNSSGAYTWTIPTTLASGARYRIKIAAYYDSSIYAYSDTFSISGLVTDKYERDNKRDSASIFDSLGRSQSRSLTYNDSDWVAFSATKGRYYSIQTNGGAVTYVYLYCGKEASYTASSSGSTSTLTTKLGFSCDTTGTWYVCIRPYTYGDYTLKIVEIDPLAAVTFTAPTASTTWSAGSAYTIQWQADTALFGQTVQLYLCNDTATYLSISSYTTNNGQQTWSIPQYLSTSDKYRIRIVSSTYTGIVGYSKPFTISGIMPDAYENDNSRNSARSFGTLGETQNRSLTYNDSDWVSFTAVAGKTYVVQTVGDAISHVYLYYGNKTGYASSTSGSTLTHRSTLVHTADSSGTYYALIRTYSSSYCGNYVLKISEINPFTCAVFTAPTAATTWSTGTSYAIQWQVDTVLFDRTIRLDLCEDTTTITPITSYSASNSGTYTWSIPTTLSTSNTYRIRITSGTNTSVVGYSAQFTISGIAKDTFEVDGTPGKAKPIAVNGTAQNHTLTLSDTDWVAFPARAGMSYSINSNASFSHRIYLYLKNTASYINYTSGINNKLSHTPTDTGMYYIKVCSYSTSYAGSYTLSVREYDPNNMVVFSSPVSSSTWSCGSNYSILWTPDTSLFSSTVRLYLAQDTVSLISIITSTANDGVYSWTVPSGLESAATYRIKMVDYSNTSLIGYSQRFTISGLPVDTFEVDDSASRAHPITIGRSEAHTLPYLDVDWFSFNAVASKLYVIETTDSLNTRMELYAANLTTLLASDDNSGTNNNARITWISTGTATCYFKVLSSYTGSYHVQVNAYDSTAYRYTVTSPVAGSSYPAGATCPITWTSTIPLGGLVDVFLYNAAGVVTTISASAIDDGSLVWGVPTTVAPGTNYRIKVTNHSVSDVMGFSGVFTITAR